MILLSQCAQKGKSCLQGCVCVFAWWCDPKNFECCMREGVLCLCEAF